jgi:integrase
MPTNKLTDAKCRAAKPSDKPLKLFDGEGLHLFVSPKGAKVWRVAFRVDGKPQTKSLGPYPAVGLAEARAKRDGLKGLLRDGLDPRDAAKPKAKGLTFRAACEAYWAGRKDVSATYRANATRGLELHLCTALGDKDVGRLTRDDLMAELQRMDAAGLHVYVRKVRMWAGQVLDWAVEHGHATANPASSIKPEKAFGAAPVEHHAAVELREVPELMARLSMEAELQSVLACKLLALTWVRTGELRMMQWAEIDGDTWLIPAGKMKRRLDHVVPLSSQAVELLDRLKARARGSAYVFPADHRLDRPMSENAVLYLLHRIGYKGRMTGHGWRSVGSTWANENGWNPDAIERQLAHVPDNEIRAAYNRAAYLPIRRQMLQAWADWLLPSA